MKYAILAATGLMLAGCTTLPTLHETTPRSPDGMMGSDKSEHGRMSMQDCMAKMHQASDGKPMTCEMMSKQDCMAKMRHAPDGKSMKCEMMNSEPDNAATGATADEHDHGADAGAAHPQ